MNEMVSIIMPSYNSMNTIDQAIKSVLDQTYSEWELIIIDDQSTDDTIEIIEKYLEDPRIFLFEKEKNSGVAESRNIGLKNARGRFVAFLDSDDIWKKNKLELQLAFMEENNYNFSCTYYGKIDAEGNSLKHTIYQKSSMNYNELLKDGIGNSTVMYNKSKLGDFEVPIIKKRNDYALWLKVIKKSSNVYCIPQELGYHRVQEGSLSYKKTDLLKYHYIVYRKFEKLNIWKTYYLLIYWVIKTVKKKLT